MSFAEGRWHEKMLFCHEATMRTAPAAPAQRRGVTPDSGKARCWPVRRRLCAHSHARAENPRYLPLLQIKRFAGPENKVSPVFTLFRCTLKFSEFNLHDDLLAGINAMNYLLATPVQEQAIPKILDGKDLIACAHFARLPHDRGKR